MVARGWVHMGYWSICTGAMGRDDTSSCHYNLRMQHVILLVFHMCHARCYYKLDRPTRGH